MYYLVELGQIFIREKVEKKKKIIFNLALFSLYNYLGSIFCYCILEILFTKTVKKYLKKKFLFITFTIFIIKISYLYLVKK